MGTRANFFQRRSEAITVRRIFAVIAVALIVAPTTSASPPSEIETQTTGTASDTLELGIVGLAALFALIAAFYSRISAVTGPGGIGITLSSEQKSDASKAVARKVRKNFVSSRRNWASRPPRRPRCWLAKFLPRFGNDWRTRLWTRRARSRQRRELATAVGLGAPS